MVDPGEIAEVMGGTPVLGRRVRSLKDLDSVVADGIPARALRLTADRAFPAAGDARRAVLRIVPAATLKRRSRLSRTESERTERFARVVAAAEYAWSNRDDAREWLTRPHPELGGVTPLECAATELGARRVETVLDRMFFGIPS